VEALVTWWQVLLIYFAGNLGGGLSVYFLVGKKWVERIEAATEKMRENRVLFQQTFKEVRDFLDEEVEEAP
jgi:hypothetical protein